ncbi:ADP-dependent (S)-NAD(P)H-hydrate dehydratase [Tsuneonella deserti]|uniref:ADP-dependent (S)-NAD(P)H-hydrate dehydratase n=1 Tax=Tsuneonella deserti TaxID=2035528 RepID=A0ABQ1S8P7_9SPHN|nr:NAD(P)H-hydrate dehydratase [Tsuneonella deserti]GGD93777.1 ADP-dependent (S)-NAD(P)H-hydrate dehydratase [Tsuneonella deserti]
MDRLDAAWLRSHPLPPVSAEGDKNARGRVLVVGGAELVPGALRLTGEAALRAGAGKLQLATVRAAAMSLAVLVPEASMFALPADDQGEIAPEAAAKLRDRLGRSDALVFGPGMSRGERTDKLVAAVLDEAPAELTIVLDAAALTSAKGLREAVARRSGRVIMTPHFGEMSSLAVMPVEAIAGDPEAIALRIASQFNAVVALKSRSTVLASPDGQCARFEGGNAGLATSGSGDVLAGIVGGLAARGANCLTAAGWGVFIHGTAGERAAERIAEIGYLARDLVPFIPKLLAEFSQGVSA